MNMADAVIGPALAPFFVLPGMVVPIELDDAARAAVDAAQASEFGKLLIAPRLDDRYPTYGVLASIVQVGRVPGGGAAAVVRGENRAHIGSGATGPGAALWVTVQEVAVAETTDEIKALAAEYKKLLLAMLQRRSLETSSCSSCGWASLDAASLAAPFATARSRPLKLRSRRQALKHLPPGSAG